MLFYLSTWRTITTLDPLRAGINEVGRIVKAGMPDSQARNLAVEAVSINKSFHPRKLPIWNIQFPLSLSDWYFSATVAKSNFSQKLESFLSFLLLLFNFMPFSQLSSKQNCIFAIFPIIFETKLYLLDKSLLVYWPLSELGLERSLTMLSNSWSLTFK